MLSDTFFDATQFALNDIASYAMQAYIDEYEYGNDAWYDEEAFNASLNALVYPTTMQILFDVGEFDEIDPRQPMDDEEYNYWRGRLNDRLLDAMRDQFRKYENAEYDIFEALR
jgi:hypothetical protein